MLEYLVFVAAIATLLVTFVYVRSMFRGGAKPNRVSWLMWSIAPFIAAAAEFSKGICWAALPVFMSGFSPFLIFSASFVLKKAHWKLTSYDYLCGVLSALALILWLLTNDPDVAIIFAIASDALASIPTLRKAWNYPETEIAWPFIVGVFNASTSFSAIAVWAFSAYAFPAYLIVINTLLFIEVDKKKLVALITKQRTHHVLVIAACHRRKQDIDTISQEKAKKSH
jgi:hypothetical protein